jgi:RNase P subunit RPR2
MTDRTAPAPRICPNCDGFATVAITTGSRDRHGLLPTLTVDCRACNGTGTVPARRVPEAARA